MAKLGGIRFLSVPGVYFPGNDTHLLAEVLAAERPRPGSNVLDICTGSGYLAVAAARLGAGAITAADVSRRALASTRLNAMLNHVSVRVRHSDLFSALGEAMFDLIVSNPPWVPSVTDELPQSGMARAWDAGQDGRALIDPICAQAPGHLRPAGLLLLLQPMVCDTSAEPSRSGGSRWFEESHMNGPAFGLGPDEPEDQVIRREKFEAAHPEIVISAPDYSKGDVRWTAQRKDDGAGALDGLRA